MRKLLLVLSLAILSFTIVAQDLKPVQFYFEAARNSDSIGTITIRASLEKGFGLFSFNKHNTEDPFVSTVILDSGTKNISVLEPVVENGTLNTITEGGTNYQLYHDTATLIINLLLKDPGKQKIKGDISWLGKLGDAFPNGTESFEIEMAASQAVAKPIADVIPVEKHQPKGWTLFFICVLTGFLAVFTPCVFPLIPVTVSFFLKKSKTKSEGVKKAWWYAASIVIIYTIPTLILTLVFGDKFIYQVSTHPVSNLLFFLVFIIFAISFFGAFEIGLPSSWANKSDEASQRGGLTGVFFMALTLVIVSFSCTGPIVAGLLSETSGKGVSMGPAIGMLGFGVGLAIPFGIFALFPSMLQSLPRSGGWLNTVKVFFGFIELALALKFLSNADLVYHWGLLNRDVFLSIWIVIFIMLGAYLLGKIKFSHDSDVPHISITRLFVAMASFSFAVYMVPGLWGAPLKPLSGILPPPSTQAFNLDELRYLKINAPDKNEGEAVRPLKYTDKFHVPFGITAYFDLNEALAAAKKLNKPVMVDFTGWSCANCRKMENEVWSQPEVLKRIMHDFVLVSLYVDDKTELPDEEKYTNKAGEKIKTIGDKNLDYETTAFNVNAQPLYKFLDAEGKSLSDVQYGYDPDAAKFITHLENVKNTFHRK